MKNSFPKTVPNKYRKFRFPSKPTRCIMVNSSSIIRYFQYGRGWVFGAKIVFRIYPKSIYKVSIR